MDRRDFLKTAGGVVLLGGSCAYAIRLLTTPTPAPPAAAPASASTAPLSTRLWGMVIDLGKCRPGCTACLEACRKENNVAYHGDARWDVHWIRKVTLHDPTGRSGADRQVLLLCNHCDKPPCAQVCPVQATYKREDGIVIVDPHRCIGCRYCMIACPYDARMFNFKESEDWPNKDLPKRSHGVAEGCTLCAHRLDRSEKPACVEACARVNAGALLVGDLNDPDSDVSRAIAGNSVKQIREDLGTEPKVWYLGL